MKELNELTLQEARDGLQQKKFSSRELTESCLNRIKRSDNEIHAFLSVFHDTALQAADQADATRAQGGNTSDLNGIPLAIKDNILIHNFPATAASKILEPYKASYDAFVIRRLKEAGAVFLGKTNMDEFAMGSSTENSAYGATRNPHDAERVPGGSSGGSAAAVASNQCLAALGSDTGGSIRQPASFCGVVGLKPTYGSVSRHGLMAMASSLDQIGPLTKTVADAKILFSAIKGKDTLDSTTVENKPEIPEQKTKNLRVGIPKEYFGKGLDSRVGDSVHRALEKLAKTGAELIDISLPHSVYALPTYYIIMAAEVSANLARFDGIRYGFSVESNIQTSHTLSDIYTKSRQLGFGMEVKRRVMLGTYVLSAGYYDAYYTKAQKVRRLIQNDFKESFQNVDVIVGPTSPTLPFRFGERAADPLSMYIADVYTVAINLAGVPALSMPCGFVSEKNSKDMDISLPVGLQIIGNWFNEESIFSVGEIIESVLS